MIGRCSEGEKLATEATRKGLERLLILYVLRGDRTKSRTNFDSQNEKDEVFLLALMLGVGSKKKERERRPLDFELNPLNAQTMSLPPLSKSIPTTPAAAQKLPQTLLVLVGLIGSGKVSSAPSLFPPSAASFEAHSLPSSSVRSFVRFV